MEIAVEPTVKRIKELIRFKNCFQILPETAKSFKGLMMIRLSFSQIKVVIKAMEMICDKIVV